MGAPAVITIVDFSTWSYRADIADFGNALSSDMVYAASLVTPPDDPRLCKFPPSFAVHNETNTFTVQTPIAILASLGGCSVEQKADVALRIKQNITGMLQYLVLYNNDPNNPDEIVTLSLPQDHPDFSSLGFVSLSTSTGVAIMGRIEQLALVTGTSPTLLTENNRRWRLPTVIELLGQNSGNHNSGNGVSSGRSAAQDFYWFRFVLFSLLILSPCCRAGYLFWAGGGRLRFRRNEHGRIVGWQYIPPMSYWFASGPTTQARDDHVTDRLTEEQVLALPQIIYKSPSRPKDISTEDETNPSTNEAGDIYEEINIQVTSGSLDDGDDAVNAHRGEDDINIPTQHLSPTNSVDTVESQPVETRNVTDNATSCTACSICIDDFDEGELLRYLPRCKHAFHTECIMPWLTERQGYCPLCKTAVLDPIEQPENCETTLPAGEAESGDTEGETPTYVVVLGRNDQGEPDTGLSSVSNQANVDQERPIATLAGSSIIQAGCNESELGTVPETQVNEETHCDSLRRKEDATLKGNPETLEI